MIILTPEILKVRAFRCIIMYDNVEIIRNSAGEKMFLYIVRHGETYGNLNGNGFSETDLSPKGEEQVKLLGERFKDEKIDKIYTSPLLRALKTTNAVSQYHKNTPVYIDGMLFEKGTAPDYTGMGEKAIKELCPEGILSPIAPLGKESNEATLLRARQVISKIKAENPFESTVMIVAHGSLNNYLVLAALGFPLKDNFNFSHINTGVTLIEYLMEGKYERTKLKYLNDASHLFFSRTKP